MKLIKVQVDLDYNCSQNCSLEKNNKNKKINSKDN